MIKKDLIEINRMMLLGLSNLLCANSEISGFSPRLIFPLLHNKLRISEQEARLVYCNILNNSNYFYSIETPTIEKYQFSGISKSTASSDLSIYSYDNKFNKVANVEFKSHNVEYKNIAKDIEKLLKEKILGNWFHILENCDSGTLGSLFVKFKNSLIEHIDDIDDTVSILFTFYSYNNKWGCYKHFMINKAVDKRQYIDSFFRIDYKAVKQRITVIEDNGWNVVELK